MGRINKNMENISSREVEAEKNNANCIARDTISKINNRIGLTAD